jgi:hypothetical protein
MANKSFILHIDSLCILDKLSTEQKGNLFDAIYRYQLSGEVQNLDTLTEIVFTPFLNQFKRDAEKYVSVVEKRREAGAKGGKQKVANATNSKQKVAKVADSDSKNDSDSKKDNEFSMYNSLIDLGGEKQLIKDWLLVRKNKKATNTQTALDAFMNQVEKSNMSINEVLEKCIEKSWSGFNVKWLKEETNSFNTGTQTLTNIPLPSSGI